MKLKKYQEEQHKIEKKMGISSNDTLIFDVLYLSKHAANT